MATQVRETAAAKSISAYVILNKKGEQVATVQAHFSNSGRVTVDVWNTGDAACLRSLKTARKTGRINNTVYVNALHSAPDYYPTDVEREEHAAFTLFHLQHGSAGGYGYDKFTAALSGLIIDGHTMADHCGTVPECESARERLLKAHQKADRSGVDGSRADKVKADKIGARFANWNSDNCSNDSLNFIAGLDRLLLLGYRVITAI